MDSSPPNPNASRKLHSLGSIHTGYRNRMKEKINLFLDWALPITCAVNVILYWGSTAIVIAWVVATAGWTSNLFQRYKKV